MPPRHHTLPPAQTSSAREAQKSFFCALCNKGYSRMNDYEAHLSSYDHSHKQRLKDMKAMVRDPNAGERARKAEAKAQGLISIKLPEQESAAPAAGTGFKKAGFKKSGFKSSFAPVEATAASITEEILKSTSTPAGKVIPGLDKSLAVESDTEDEGYEVYDPRFPTE